MKPVTPRRSGLHPTVLVALFAACSHAPDEPTLPPCDAVYASYRVTSASLPASSSEAHDVAFDMNGDELPDNVVGGALAAFALQVYDGVENSFEAGLNRSLGNRALWIVQIGRCEDEPFYRALSLQQGTDNDLDEIPSITTRAPPRSR